MEVKTPKKRGRKPVVIDYERVEYLASLNMGIMDICRSLGIGWDTFNKHRNKKNSELKERLDKGKAKGLQLATTKLMEKIQEGEFNAIQFYLKSADRETWAEKQTVEHNLNLAGILDSARERVKVIDHNPTRLPKRAQKLSKNAQRDGEGEGANE